MLKSLFAILVLGSSFSVFAADEELVCQGFFPEAKLECFEGAKTHIVHAFEEAQCGKGRNGLLDNSVPIQEVDGPLWTDGNPHAQVSFQLNGETVFLKTCDEIVE